MSNDVAELATDRTDLHFGKDCEWTTAAGNDKSANVEQENESENPTEQHRTVARMFTGHAA
jgi:hypothetical protein